MNRITCKSRLDVPDFLRGARVSIEKGTPYSNTAIYHDGNYWTKRFDKKYDLYRTYRRRASRRIPCNATLQLLKTGEEFEPFLMFELSMSTYKALPVSHLSLDSPFGDLRSFLTHLKPEHRGIHFENLWLLTQVDFLPEEQRVYLTQHISRWGDEVRVLPLREGYQNFDLSLAAYLDCSHLGYKEVDRLEASWKIPKGCKLVGRLDFIAYAEEGRYFEAHFNQRSENLTRLEAFMGKPAYFEPDVNPYSDGEDVYFCAEKD